MKYYKQRKIELAHGLGIALTGFFYIGHRTEKNCVPEPMVIGMKKVLFF